EASYFNYVIYDPQDTSIIGRDAREKGQTREEMISWAKEVADRNDAKRRQWESDARARQEQESGQAYERILSMAARKAGPRKQRTVGRYWDVVFGSTGGTTRQIRAI